MIYELGLFEERNTFFCYNRISLSRHEQVCLMNRQAKIFLRLSLVVGMCYWAIPEKI